MIGDAVAGGATPLAWRDILTTATAFWDLLMVATAFDTLKYANTLKAAGVPASQAEAQASVLGEALAVNFKDLATKDDILAVKNDILAVKNELTTALGATEQRFDAKLTETEQRLNAKINLVRENRWPNHLLKWMIRPVGSLNIAVLDRRFPGACSLTTRKRPQLSSGRG